MGSVFSCLQPFFSWFFLVFLLIYLPKCLFTINNIQINACIVSFSIYPWQGENHLWSFERKKNKKQYFVFYIYFCHNLEKNYPCFMLAWSWIHWRISVKFYLRVFLKVSFCKSLKNIINCDFVHLSN